MAGLLSAEVYKLARSKSFYICIAVVIGVIVMMYVMLGMIEGKREDGTGSVVVITQAQDSEASIWEEFDTMELVGQSFSGDLIPCILAIFVSIFVIGEHAGGMMKNVAGKGCERWKIFLSKLLVTELASVLIILTGIATALACSLLYQGSSAFAGDFWKNFAVFMGLQLLLEAAFAAVIMFTSDLCRNYAAGISLGIGISAFPVILLEGFNLLFSKSSFVPSDYWLVTRSISCPYEGFTPGYIVQTLLVAGIWFLLASGAGVWHFSRTDIK